MTDPLTLAARHGRWVLVAGLVCGLALPGLAELMRPALPALVAVLLLLSLLRLRPGGLRGGMRALPRVVGVVLALQLALPSGWLLLAGLAGLTGTPAALALLLMLAAPSIAGAPNIAMMLGARPDPALRLMVAGTVLLPLTVLPLFALSPALGEASQVIRAALILLATIAAAAGLSLAVRRLWPNPSRRARDRLDGVSALVLAVFVIGLMPQVSRVALTDPMRVAGWAALAFCANLGLQALAWRLGRSLPHDDRLALSVIAGNRNVALFLLSLPVAVTTPLLPFIGCYQLPMYLTPLLMRRLYAQRRPDPDPGPAA